MTTTIEGVPDAERDARPDRGRLRLVAALTVIAGLSAVFAGVVFLVRPGPFQPTELQHAQQWCDGKGQIYDGNRMLTVRLTGDTTWTDVNCILTKVDTPDAVRTRIRQATTSDPQPFHDSWPVLDVGLTGSISETWTVDANGVLTVIIREDPPAGS